MALGCRLVLVGEELLLVLRILGIVWPCWLCFVGLIRILLAHECSLLNLESNLILLHIRESRVVVWCMRGRALCCLRLGVRCMRIIQKNKSFARVVIFVMAVEFGILDLVI